LNRLVLLRVEERSTRISMYIRAAEVRSCLGGRQERLYVRL
jgi:hypothetical protein